MLRRLAFAAAVGVAAVLAMACSSGGDGRPAGTAAPDAAGEDLTRSAEAGGVTVEATWLTEATAGEVDADLSAYPSDETYSSS